MTEHWTISHDFAYAHGGAERVTSILANVVLPSASVRLIAGDPGVIRQLGLQRATLTGRGYSPDNYRTRSLLEPLRLGLGSEIEGNVLSSSYAFAHHVRMTGAHVVYCHSPLRQIWSGQSMYTNTSRTVPSLALKLLAPALRAADQRAARAADAYIATNKTVATRVESFYGIHPVAIVPPPVDTRFFQQLNEREDYFVWAGRIVEPYKRLGLVLEAFRTNGHRLVVAGSGRDESMLRERAGSNVTFAGPLDTAELAQLYARSRAVIFPSEDDFGMVPIEAMASGTPIIAWNGGGVVETVNETTGMFFNEPTAASLNAAIADFACRDWSHAAIQDHAQMFSSDSFRQSILSVLSEFTAARAR